MTLRSLWFSAKRHVSDEEGEWGRRGGGNPSRAWQSLAELRKQRLGFREAKAAQSCKTELQRGEGYAKRELQKPAKKLPE